MDDTTYRIDQKRFLRGRQTLILDGDMLKVEFRRGLSLHEYRFDLRGFHPDPVRVKTVPLARFVVAALLGAVSIAFIAVGILSTTDDQTFGAIFGGLIFLLLTIVVGSSIPKMMANVILFRGPGGQAVLWPDLPSKAEFSEFMTQMSSRIHQAGNHEQHLLRRLRVAEIINDWQYDQAMELLKQGDDRSDAS
jgi:hypothetical protein